MKQQKSFKLKGTVIVEKRDKQGNVLEKTELENLIVNSGKERVAKLLNGVSSTTFNSIAIGTGTTSPTTSDTSLETEITRAQADGSGAYEADYKAVFEKTFSFGSGESYNITEAGVFDNATASGSTMLDRFTFGAQAVDADTDLYIKVTITVS